MNVARAKLDLIKPEEVSMDEYEVSRGVPPAFSCETCHGCMRATVKLSCKAPSQWEAHPRHREGAFNLGCCF